MDSTSQEEANEVNNDEVDTNIPGDATGTTPQEEANEVNNDEVDPSEDANIPGDATGPQEEEANEVNNDEVDPSEDANIPGDAIGTNGYNPGSLEEFIEWLKVTPSEIVLQHGGIANSDRLKEVARKLKLPTKRGKKELYENIMKFWSEQQHLDELGVGAPGDATGTNGNNPGSLEEFIEWLKVTPSITVLQHGGIAKLDQLKAVAKKLKLPTKRGKKELYENIIKHFSAEVCLDELGVGGSSSSDGYISKPWHIIRIINCIFWDGEEQINALSCALATRDQLQSRETGAGHQLWVEGAEKFNDVNYHSGSLRVDAEVLFTEDDAIVHRASYDPEQTRETLITAKAMRTEFNKCKKHYQANVERWTARGKHNGGEAVFIDYCNHDIGQLYLFHVLKMLGNPELDSFMGEGAAVEGDVDTGDGGRGRGGSNNTEKSSRKKQKHDTGETLAEFTRQMPNILNGCNANQSNSTQLSDLGELQSQIGYLQQHMNETRREIRREQQQDPPDEAFVEDLKQQYQDYRTNYLRLRGYLENAHSGFTQGFTASTTSNGRRSSNGSASIDSNSRIFSRNMKVRAITLFITCDSWEDVIPNIVAANHSAIILGNEFKTMGYEVQTLRISMNSFEEWVRPGETIESVKDVVKILDELKIDFFNIGPAISAVGRSYLLEILLLSSRISSSCCCSIKDSNGTYQIDEDAINDSANIILKLGTDTEGGIGNFRFCATSCMLPYVPFFPAASAPSCGHSIDGSSDVVSSSTSNKCFSFAIGLESGSIALNALTETSKIMADTKKRIPISMIKQSLINAFTSKLVPLETDSQTIAQIVNDTLINGWRVKYHGIDSSLNPGIEADASVGAAFEVALGGKPFGSTGTLAVASAVTHALKSIPVKLCGYSGLMLPPLEDSVLASRQRYPPTYGITDLLAYSSVCGVGFDTVPIPGNTRHEDVAALILDTVALSVKWTKPLSCRLFPVTNKAAGEETTFNSPYLVNTGVFRVP